MTKKENAYIIMTLDEWRNSTLIGFFTDLGEATKAVKETHPEMKGIEELELVEYMSSFGMQINADIHNDEEGTYLDIIGFVITKDSLKKVIAEL